MKFFTAIIASAVLSSTASAVEVGSSKTPLTLKNNYFDWHVPGTYQSSKDWGRLTNKLLLTNWNKHDGAKYCASNALPKKYADKGQYANTFVVQMYPKKYRFSKMRFFYEPTFDDAAT